VFIYTEYRRGEKGRRKMRQEDTSKERSDKKRKDGKRNTKKNGERRNQRKETCVRNYLLP
jgi:hypothetical protein